METNGRIEAYLWRQVAEIGIGARYHRPDPGKIRCRETLDKYLEEHGFEQGRGLFMIGPVGVGKSTALAYLAYGIALILGHTYLRSDPDDEGHWESPAAKYIGYASSAWLFKAFRQFDDHDSRARVRALMNRPMLLLDDLGREYRSEMTISDFEEFVEYRYARCLATVVVSNLDPKALTAIPGYGRVVDRFRDPRWLELVMVAGESMRR